MDNGTMVAGHSDLNCSTLRQNFQGLSLDKPKNGQWTPVSQLQCEPQKVNDWLCYINNYDPKGFK